MRVSQYVYLVVYSTSMAAAEVTGWLGVEPDEFMVRGSRMREPARPVSHQWKVVCRERGLTVDEQVAHLVKRLSPYADRIGDLVDELAQAGDGGCTLQVVRYFDDPDGEEERLDTVAGLTKLPGQHQLLGWHLDADVLDFLRRVRAELDIDEYG